MTIIGGKAREGPERAGAWELERLSKAVGEPAVASGQRPRPHFSPLSLVLAFIPSRRVGPFTRIEHCHTWYVVIEQTLINRLHLRGARSRVLGADWTQNREVPT